MLNSDQEELNSKCWNCSSGLSSIECSLYKNRCTFCVEDVKKFNLLKYYVHTYYDYRIYKHQIRLLGPDGNAKFYGVLGVFGYSDINQVDTVKKKKQLIVELKDMK